MKRSGGVTAWAVIAILGSLVVLLFGVMMALTPVLGRMEPLPPNTPAFPFSPTILMLLMSAFYLGFGIWGIVSAIGLFRLRNWARICFIVFGTLLSLFSICGAMGMVLAIFLMPKNMPTANNVPPGLFQTVLVVMAVVALACAGLGVASIVYFTRRSVKLQFLGEAVESLPRRFPLTITIIAWWLVLGGAMIVLLPFFSLPALVFGFVLQGWSARLVLAVFSAASLAAGVGLLRGQRWAHSLAVAYMVVGLLNSAAYFLPGSIDRAVNLYGQSGGTPPLAANILATSMWFGVTFSVGVMVIGLWLLIRRRAAYLEACDVRA